MLRHCPALPRCAKAGCTWLASQICSTKSPVSCMLFVLRADANQGGLERVAATCVAQRPVWVVDQIQGGPCPGLACNPPTLHAIPRQGLLFTWWTSNPLEVMRHITGQVTSTQTCRNTCNTCTCYTHTYIHMQDMHVVTHTLQYTMTCVLRYEQTCKELQS